MDANIQTKDQADLVLIVPTNLKEAENLRQKLTDNALLLQNNVLTLQNIQIQMIVSASQSVSEYENLLADSTKDLTAVKLQIQALDKQISLLREQKELGVLQNTPVVAKLLFRAYIPGFFVVRNLAALGVLLITICATLALCSVHWMMVAGVILMAGLWSTVHLNSIKYRVMSTEKVLLSRETPNTADNVQVAYPGHPAKTLFSNELPESVGNKPVAVIADKSNSERDGLVNEVISADEVKETWMTDPQLIAQSKQLVKDWNQKIKECGLGDATNEINFVIYSSKNITRGAAELAARAFNESKQFLVEVKKFGYESMEIFIKSK